MAFPNLPDELVLLIAESLSHDASALNALAQSSRHLASVVTPLLNQLAMCHPKLTSGSSSVLVWAIMHGNEGLARLALEKGCATAIQSQGPLRYTALHLAAMAEHGGEAIIRLLLENGADTDAVNLYRRTPLHCAAMCGLEGAVRLLLDHGADPNALEDVVFHGRVTPLYWAAKKNHHDTVKVLLEYGAETASSGVNKDRQYILHWAARHKDPKILRLLLENGADITTRDNNGETALHWAAKFNREATVRILLARGANTATRNRAGETPLHLAIISKYERTVKAILSHGTDSRTWSTATNRPATNGYNALHLATESGSCAIFDHLVGHGADIAVRTHSTNTVLHLAAIAGDEAMVSHVLSKGFAIDAQNADGNTALHCAVLSGRTAVSHLLLQKGASVTIANTRGRTVRQLKRPGEQWMQFDEALKARQTGCGGGIQIYALYTRAVWSVRRGYRKRHPFRK